MALTLKYDFATDKSLVAAVGPTLTCTRTGNATYFDNAGVMQTAGTNTARFDHNPSTQASLGLLVEEARTNVNTYSEDASSWSHNNSITVDSNAATAPDGTLTADRMNVSVASAWHGARNYNAGGHGTPSTWSVYVKNDGADYVGLTRLTASEQFETVVFNLLTGTETLQDVGTTSGTIDASGIEDVGNGWFRLYMTVSAVDSGYYGILLFSQASPTLDASGREVFLGVDGNDLLIWGAQLEGGAFPTSYIPTTSASVTRNADVVNTTDVSWHNKDGSSWYGNAIPVVEKPTAALLSINNGSSEKNEIYLNGPNKTQSQQTSSGVSIGWVTETSPLLVTGVSYKWAMANAADDLSQIYRDGTGRGTADTDTSGKVPGDTLALNKFSVGCNWGSANQWSGHIAEIRYYNTRLTDAELEDMSNGIFPAEGGNFYIATTRRTASQMRPKQRMRKPRRGLFR